MGLTSPAARAALEKAARTRTSSFSTVTAPSNIYSSNAQVKNAIETIPYIYKPTPTTTTTTTTGGTKPSTTTRPKVDINIRGKNWEGKGYYYQVSMDFALGINFNEGDKYLPKPVKNIPKPSLTAEEKANWGLGYGNPLVNPRNWCEYLVRVQIFQPTRDLLIRGYELQWFAPTGWSFVDGQPLKMLVEVTSDPCVIIRKVMSPKTAKIPNNVVFRVAVLKVYP